MATVQETSNETKDTVINIKIPAGSQLEQRIEFLKGDLDISAAELLRRAVDAFLLSNGMGPDWTPPEVQE